MSEAQPIESPGITRAWEELSRAEPERVVREAGAEYRPEKGGYLFRSLGADFLAETSKREIEPIEEGGRRLLEACGYYLAHAALWYLTTGRRVAETGRHLRPKDLPGGDSFFVHGMHRLPLEELAAKYGTDPKAFEARSEELGGSPAEWGDRSTILRPLPHLPVTIILWLEDEEFPPRMDLLLDSSAVHQGPLDVIWSAALYTLLAYH